MLSSVDLHQAAGIAPSYDRPGQVLKQSMFATHARFRQLAALLLVAWLFAYGVAVAQACVTHAHVAAEDCCTVVQVPTLRAGPMADAAAPSQPMPALLPGTVADTPLFHTAAELPQNALHAAWRDSGQRIPIVFLRLAL